MKPVALAIEAAKKKAARKPEADAYTQAKRAAQGKRATELYDLFVDFGGKRVDGPNGRGFLDVTQALNAAHISVSRALVRHYSASEAKRRKLKENPAWAKTGEVIDGWSAWHDGDSYIVKRRMGPEKKFAQVEDVVDHVAAEIGEMLVLEE